jgi:predicted negative regulator of RcsB-dependent stress response
VINEHLGDAFWRTGRIREARFQWQRALTLSPDDEVARLLRDKLENGLES